MYTAWTSQSSLYNMWSTDRKLTDSIDVCFAHLQTFLWGGGGGGAETVTIGPALLIWLAPSSNVCLISPVDFQFNKDGLVSLLLTCWFSVNWKRKSAAPLLRFLFSLSDTGCLLRCNSFGLLCRWTELDLWYARRVGKERRHLGEVYDFVHRNNLLSVFLDLDLGFPQFWWAKFVSSSLT